MRWNESNTKFRKSSSRRDCTRSAEKTMTADTANESRKKRRRRKIRGLKSALRHQEFHRVALDLRASTPSRYLPSLHRPWSKLRTSSSDFSIRLPGYWTRCFFRASHLPTRRPRGTSTKTRRFGKIFRSGQSRQTDGADCQTRRADLALDTLEFGTHQNSTCRLSEHVRCVPRETEADASTHL